MSTTKTRKPAFAPTPQQIAAARAEAEAVVALFRDQPDDLQLRLDTAEGETGVLDMLDALAELVVADELLVERLMQRKQRLEARADKHREWFQQIFSALGGGTMHRPLYTATLRDGVQQPRIVDEALVPDEFWKRNVDRVALGKAAREAAKAGAKIPGTELSNAPPVLQIKST